MNGNPAFLFNTTSIIRGLVPPEMEISALPQAAMNRNLTWETIILVDQDIAHQGPLGILNENSSLSNDDSLADLRRRAAQNCFLFEKNLKKREEILEKKRRKT